MKRIHSFKCSAVVSALLLSVVMSVTSATAAVTISADPTSNMMCSSGVCTPTNTDAILNVGDLEALLAAGNVSVTTTGSGLEANDIDVIAPFSWATSGALALSAHQSIIFNSSVSVQGTGGVSIAVGNHANVPLYFLRGASLSFEDLSDVLSINGTRYKLESTITKLARAIAAHPRSAFALAKDYSARHDRIYSASPIAIPFEGKFTGLGHVITELSLVDEADFSVGVFSTVLSKGMISNIGITKLVIAGRQTIGGLVGTNEGTISNSYASGSVRGSDPSSDTSVVGGLAGYNAGTITNCQANVRVADGFVAGGLVGENAGSVDRSFASGTTLGSGIIGGLVGANSGASITINGLIANSYSTSSAKAPKSGATTGDVGGLVGYNPGLSPNLSMINTSYSTGTVSAPTRDIIGGFVGEEEGISTNSYWDTTTSGWTQAVGEGGDAGITPLTSEELQSALPAGFDPAIWGQSSSINNGFPYLIDNPPQ
jgi:The GLUG motif